jgi:hypothetical protein
MEPYPHHYSHRSRAADKPPVDPTLRFIVLNELQKMESRLDDRIEGRCGGGLERRVEEAEQRFKERLISLGMARAKAEQGRAPLKKQFDGLKLKVHRMNRFLERDNLVNQQEKQGIFTSKDGSFTNQSMGDVAGGLKSRRADATQHQQGRGGVPSQTTTCAASTSNTNFCPRGVETAVDLRHPSLHESRSESGRGCQGRLPKLHFSAFWGGGGFPIMAFLL